jgi:hypothetical protein
MAKFSRIMKFSGGFHTISHQGNTYKEEKEGTGLFEAPHDHADHFKSAGFAEDFADDWNAAEEKLTAPEVGEAKEPAAAQPALRKKL